MNVHDTEQTDKAQLFRNIVAQAAEKLVAAGYRIIPIRGKDPYEQGWQTKTYPSFILQDRALNGDNLGLLFGQEIRPGWVLCGLDVDVHLQAEAEAIWRTLGWDVPIRFGNRPKFLIPFIARREQGVNRDHAFYSGDERIAIQVLGPAQKAPYGPKQAAVFGIHPGTGRPYFWQPDSHSRGLFDMRPEDWPVVDDLPALMERIAAVLATMPKAWQPRAKHARAPGAEAAYSGPLTERQIAADKALFEQTIADLSNMGPGEFRGTRAHQIGLQLGATVRAGHIDLDQAIERLREAMPDNHNALREFERGVMASEGHRQRANFERQNTDWTGQASAQGLKPEDFMGTPPPNPETAKAQEDAQRAEAEQIQRDTYKLGLQQGACDIMASAVKERDPEKRTRDEGVAWGFMASLLAAGMATLDEMQAKWAASAGWLGGINLTRYGPDAQRITDALKSLQPTEAGWASYAAGLMAKGRSPGEAIRAAQFAHRAARQRGAAASGSVEADILSSVQSMQDWDRDANGDAEGGSFSNFKFFMASQLSVWPFYDDFTETIQFRRLIWDLKVVPDPTLERWTRDTDAAAVELYAMARDRQAPWGTANYTPSRSDIAIWIAALIGDDGRRRFNSVARRMAEWEEWDGRDRLSDWLARYTETAPWEPAYAYVCGVGAHFLRNWAYRMENPGHKHDEVPVLVGLQGERKTTLFEALADVITPGSYLAGQRLDFDGKTGINRMAEATRGKTLVEMAELTSLGRRDMENLKALISNREDSGRKTYGSASYDRARQFCLVGTANCSVPHTTAEDITIELQGLSGPARSLRKRELMAEADKGFLTDPTGSRRFHPVLVNSPSMDLESLREEAAQLIAQARAEASAGPQARLMSQELVAMAAQVVKSFYATDGLADEIMVKLLMHLEGAPDFKIPLSDVRRVLGHTGTTANGAGARKLNAALESCGLRTCKSGAHWAYRGDWSKAKRVALIEGPGAIRIVPMSGG